jgi:hypothetical protein
VSVALHSLAGHADELDQTRVTIENYRVDLLVEITGHQIRRRVPNATKRPSADKEGTSLYPFASEPVIELLARSRWQTCPIAGTTANQIARRVRGIHQEEEILVLDHDRIRDAANNRRGAFGKRAFPAFFCCRPAASPPLSRTV